MFRRKAIDPYEDLIQKVHLGGMEEKDRINALVRIEELRANRRPVGFSFDRFIQFITVLILVIGAYLTSNQINASMTQHTRSLEAEARKPFADDQRQAFSKFLQLIAINLSNASYQYNGDAGSIIEYNGGKVSINELHARIVSERNSIIRLLENSGVAISADRFVQVDTFVHRNRFTVDPAHCGKLDATFNEPRLFKCEDGAANKRLALEVNGKCGRFRDAVARVVSICMRDALAETLAGRLHTTGRCLEDYSVSNESERRRKLVAAIDNMINSHLPDNYIDKDCAAFLKRFTDKS